MSHRPIKDKGLRRLRKALRRGRLQRYINLYDYLLDRRLVRTKKEARELILAKRVRVDSHPIGVKTGQKLNPVGKLEEVEYVDPIIPADARGRIVVSGS